MSDKVKLKFTPTEERILALLSDGKAHLHSHIIKKCLWDELTSRGTLKVHVANIRKKIRPYGHDIICRYHGHINCVQLFYYQHVSMPRPGALKELLESAMS